MKVTTSLLLLSSLLLTQQQHRVVYGLYHDKDGEGIEEFKASLDKRLTEGLAYTLSGLRGLKDGYFFQYHFFYQDE